MTPYPALARLRIGCVQYLNARPLIHGYEGPVEFDHPSGLARSIVAGKLDAALVPVFEAVGSRSYLLVDGAAIASSGPVYSVFLAYRGELSAVRTITLDPASLTSVHLLKVLLAEYHQMSPVFADSRSFEGEPDARLLIGNQAIDFRRQMGNAFTYLDLGEEWKRRTGLPFVYALWLMRADVPDAEGAANAFRELKAYGVERVEEIIASEQQFDEAFRRSYLTEYLRFEFGPDEKAGLEHYRHLLLKHGFVQPPLPPLRYV